LVKKIAGLLLAGLLWVAFISAPVFAQKTDNLNILFLGFEANKLEMIAVYSINHQQQMQSGALFVPVQALIPQETQNFRDYYQQQGIKPLQDKIAKMLDITIAYHVLIDNEIMDETERIIGAIHVDGKKVNLKKLFTTPAGPKDEQVLGEIMSRFTQKEVYFWKLPLLITAYRRYVVTDFPLTIENLWLHYRIATGIPTNQIKKVILPLSYGPVEGDDSDNYHWQLNRSCLKTAIYDLTK